jgi:hypothetical protein
MVVFLADYPEDITDARDGYSQRIAAVDSVFSDMERVYLRISFRGHRRKKVQVRGRVRVEALNFYLHHNSIVQWLQRAQVVYVHSIYHAIYLWPYFSYLRDKLILDLHGIVPEELSFVGKRSRARIFGFVEKRTVQNSLLVIAVTEKMAEHILRKYSGRIDASRVLVLPNVELRQNGSSLPCLGPKMHEALRLIYAGDVGKWHKIDLIIETLRRVTAAYSHARARLYVPPGSLPMLQEKVKRLRLDDRISVGTLPHQELLKEYLDTDVGFVLREDMTLNQVSMPTKLVEYMSHGVVPIVLSPDLGDLVRDGYRYLTIEDLFNPEKLSPAILDNMRAENLRIMAAIRAQALQAQTALKSLITRSQMGPDSQAHERSGSPAK